MTGQEPPAGGHELGTDPSTTPEETSNWRKLLQALDPRFVMTMAHGYPVVLKQFIQFCLVLVYPGWVLGILGCLVVYGAFYVTVYPVLWVLFWPMRAWMKKNRPEEYAASRKKK